MEFTNGTKIEMMTTKEAVKIVKFLATLNIKAVVQMPFIKINRDSMCKAFSFPEIPEEAHYPETLKRIRVFMNSNKFNFSGKTDEDYFLDKF